MIEIPFTPNYKLHFFVGLITSVWLVLFLILIAPFDVSDLSFKVRWIILPWYGLISLGSYLLLLPLQKWLFHKSKRWNFFMELTILFLFTLICLAGAFWYYKTDIVNGEYDLVVYITTVYIPILLILMPLVIGMRWIITKTKLARRKKMPFDSVEELAIWKQKIDALTGNGIFLNPKITLQETASQLGTNTSVLSKVINGGYGLNFNDFINKIRVEAVVERIQKGEHKLLTLNAIAEECGFSSKSTFNRAFKKFLKLSPSEYIKNR